MEKLEKKVAVGMPRELYDELKKRAEADRRSIPGYIRLALWDHIGK